MTSEFFRQRAWLIICVGVVLAACATGPQITRTQEVPSSADKPYRKVLVIALFSSFNARKQFEKEVVRQLAALGTEAVTSTSMMKSTTPMTRQTYLPMVEQAGADGVLVSQVANMASEAAMIDMSPEATRNITPTYYFNVWEVELTEYVEPQSIEVKRSLVLATQLYSVSTREPVWAIESRSEIVTDPSQPKHYPFIVNEAEAITAYLLTDGLIEQTGAGR